MLKIMEIKYTSDGKKVGIVGKLNSQETIVQEIFVSAGQEIPSGENFVVKSLHDAPAVSWKEKNLKELEDRYESDRKRHTAQLERLENGYREQIRRVEAILNASKKFADLCDIDKDIETVADLLTGKVKFVVTHSYGVPKLQEYEKFKIHYDRDLKLITLFGCTDGRLQFRINSYSDGSGGNENVFFFKDKESAIEKFIEICKNGYISEEMIKASKEYGFDLDPEKLQRWKTETTNSNQKRIDEALANIEKWKLDNERLSEI